MEKSNGKSLSSTTAGGADATLNRASSSAHAAVDSIAGSADEVARKAKPAIDRAASMAHQAVEKATDAASPTADWLDEQSERLKAAQSRLAAGTTGYVSANPLKSVALAVVAGLVLSQLFR